MADGWYCKKCNASVQDESTRHHYRAVHQPTSFIRLPGSAAKVRIDRDPQTRRFKCPRIGCMVSLELAQEVQEHVRRCLKPLHFYPEEPSSEKRPNGHALHTSAAASRRYAGRYSNAGSASASPEKGDSLSARTLRAHTASTPQTTRTKRALIRHCYQGGDMMISEIAEFVNCDHRTVWAVIRNEGGDDLEEDKRYLNCEVGDIVNVETLGEMKPFVKREPADDDRALLAGGSASDQEYDSEAEVEDQYVQPDTPPPRRKRRLSVESDISMLSSLTSLADGEDEGSNAAMSISDVKSNDYAGPSHAQWQSASPGPSSTVSSGTLGSPATTKIKTDGVVEAFLNSFGGPSDRLVQLFYEMEIDSAERLDWLCTMQGDYWEDVKDYLLRNGVKLFHWLVVKKGLRDRAAALAANGSP